MEYVPELFKKDASFHSLQKVAIPYFQKAIKAYQGIKSAPQKLMYGGIKREIFLVNTLYEIKREKFRALLED